MWVCVTRSTSSFSRANTNMEAMGGPGGITASTDVSTELMCRQAVA